MREMQRDAGLTRAKTFMLAVDDVAGGFGGLSLARPGV